VNSEITAPQRTGPRTTSTEHSAREATLATKSQQKTFSMKLISSAPMKTQSARHRLAVSITSVAGEPAMISEVTSRFAD